MQSSRRGAGSKGLRFPLLRVRRGEAPGLPAAPASRIRPGPGGAGTPDTLATQVRASAPRGGAPGPRPRAHLPCASARSKCSCSASSAHQPRRPGPNFAASRPPRRPAPAVSPLWVSGAARGPEGSGPGRGASEGRAPPGGDPRGRPGPARSGGSAPPPPPPAAKGRALWAMPSSRHPERRAGRTGGQDGLDGSERARPLRGRLGAPRPEVSGRPALRGGVPGPRVRGAARAGGEPREKKLSAGEIRVRRSRSPEPTAAGMPGPAALAPRGPPGAEEPPPPPPPPGAEEKVRPPARRARPQPPLPIHSPAARAARARRPQPAVDWLREAAPAPGTRPLGLRLFSKSRRPPACNFLPAPAPGSGGFPRRLRPLGTRSGDCRRRRLGTRSPGGLAGRACAGGRGWCLLARPRGGAGARVGRAQVQQDAQIVREPRAEGGGGRAPGGARLPPASSVLGATRQVTVIANTRNGVFNF